MNNVATVIGILCACPLRLVHSGAVTGLGVFRVVELQRDPRAPYESVAETFLFELIRGHNTRL